RFELLREPLEQLERMAERSLRLLYGPGPGGASGRQRRSQTRSQTRSHTRSQTQGSPGFRLSREFPLRRVWELRAGKNHSRVGFQLCNSTGGNCFYNSYSSGMDALLEWFRFHYVNIMAQLPVATEGSQHQERVQDVVYSCQYDGEPCRPRWVQTGNSREFPGNPFPPSPFPERAVPDAPRVSPGLSLILRAQQGARIPLLSTVAGLRVMIHRHNQTPFLEHEGIGVRPGIATAVAIRQDEVNRLGGNYGRCTTDGADVAVELLYNNSYTLQACLHSCFQHIMLRDCGCGYFYYPLPAGARYCDYHRHPAWGHCFYQLYRRLRSHRLNCFQQCPKPCRESLYKVSAGTARWPSAKSQGWVRQALRHQNGYNSSSRRTDVAKLSVFFQRLSSRALREAPLLSENLLLSGMGSQWSLWFGSSVLSVVEMLELLVDTLVLSLLFCFQRLRARGIPRGPDPIP
ncbi:SCNNA protein, partial [Tichodroma muraria]|nr:SCNNA protein [Tichodroma muraria]